MIFGPFWSKLVYILPILDWNWVWILRKLREWMYVYLLFQFQMNTEKERTIYDFKVDFKNLSFGVLISVMMTYLFLRDQVWNRVWILEVWSENGCGKLHVLVWNRVRIWRTRWHTPTKNSWEYPPGFFYLIFPPLMRTHPRDFSLRYKNRPLLHKLSTKGLFLPILKILNWLKTVKGLNPEVSHFISRLSMISWLNIVLHRTVVTDVSTTCALVIFRVKVSVTVNNLTTVLFRIVFTQTIKLNLLM